MNFFNQFTIRKPVFSLTLTPEAILFFHSIFLSIFVQTKHDEVTQEINLIHQAVLLAFTIELSNFHFVTVSITNDALSHPTDLVIGSSLACLLVLAVLDPSWVEIERGVIRYFFIKLFVIKQVREVRSFARLIVGWIHFIFGIDCLREHVFDLILN